MDPTKNRNEHDQPLLDEQRPSEDDIELAELYEEQTGGIERKTSSEPQTNGLSPLWVTVIIAMTVVSMTLNTEATVYFEDRLGWKKPFAIMYITHSSLALPWVCHVSYLRWKHRHAPFRQWFNDYIGELRSSIAMVDAHANSDNGLIFRGNGRVLGPIKYLFITMGYVTIAMTVSGMSWFTALALTTPADLTTIYNGSTFFAAIFSVPILKERLGGMTIAAVALSIVGTVIVAYGDSTGDHSGAAIGSSRLVGNLIACVGAAAFGLYEVLMKKWASPASQQAAQSSLSLTLAASALTGFYTIALLWILLVALHFTGAEVFVLPDASTFIWIIIAVLSLSLNMTLLILLVIWTNPVFGSMTNVLSVFFVAVADWVVWGLNPSIATYAGGVVIIVAFGMLAKDSLGGTGH